MQKNQIKCGVILSYIAQGITLLSGLLYTPVMLRILGQSEYGLYQLSNSVVSYLGLLNFGFSSGYLRIYFKLRKNNEESRIRNLNGMFLLIFGIISIIAAIMGVILIFGRNIMFGKSLTDYELEKIKPLMILMIFNLCITFMSSVFICYISAYSEFIFERCIQIARGLLNPFITLPLLLAGYGSVAMAVVSTALNLVGFIITAHYCIKKLNMKFSVNQIEKETFKELSNFTVYIFLSSVVDKINLSLDNFLLGSMSGTIMVSIYGVGSQINGFYTMISTSIANIFAPRINYIVAESNDNNKLTSLFIKISRMLFLALTAVLLGFMFFGKIFISIWAGNDYNESYYVALILMIGCSIQLLQICGIEIQKAKNMHKARSVAYFIVAISNILISIPLINMYGAVGASLGTMITMIFGNGVFMNWYYHKKIGLNMKKYWKSMFCLIPLFFPSIIVGMIYVLIVPQDNLYMGLFSMFLFVVILCLTIALVCLKKHTTIKEYIIGG